MNNKFFWFFPTPVLHCHIVEPNINPKPGPSPNIWPFKMGINLIEDEEAQLLTEGYRVEVKKKIEQNASNIQSN